jgi:circadian clock protein KaiB
MIKSRKEISWNFLLFATGDSPKANVALNNLRSICEEYIPEEYEIKVIDIKEHPELVEEHQILAIPTLIRKVPLPAKRIIGDLSNREKVIEGLGIIKKQ